MNTYKYVRASPDFVDELKLQPRELRLVSARIYIVVLRVEPEYRGREWNAGTSWLGRQLLSFRRRLFVSPHFSS